MKSLHVNGIFIAFNQSDYFLTTFATKQMIYNKLDTSTFHHFNNISNHTIHTTESYTTINILSIREINFYTSCTIRTRTSIEFKKMKQGLVLLANLVSNWIPNTRGGK